MEIRSQSKTGHIVSSLADIPAKLSQQLDAVKQQWLDRLNRDPASFARLEGEIHDRFRGLADQMTASLLATGSERSASRACSVRGRRRPSPSRKTPNANEWRSHGKVP